MPSMTVTATQGGSIANGLALRIFVLTGAKTDALQTGSAPSNDIASATAFTATGTVQQASSFIYGACDHSNQADTASGTGVSIVDAIADATNGERYTTFKNLTPATGSQTYGTTVPAASSGGAVWLEVLAASTLVEDSSGSVNSTTGATSVNLTITPPPSSLLVALVSSDGGPAVTTMAVSGGGLTWTEKVKANGSGHDYAGVWIASVPTLIYSPAPTTGRWV